MATNNKQLGKVFSAVVHIEDSIFKDELRLLQESVVNNFPFLRNNLVPREELCIGFFVFRRDPFDRTLGSLFPVAAHDENEAQEILTPGNKNATMDNVVSLVDDVVQFAHKCVYENGCNPNLDEAYPGCEDDPFAFLCDKLTVSRRGQVVMTLKQEYPACAAVVTHVLSNLHYTADAHRLKMYGATTFCIPLFTRNRATFRHAEDIGNSDLGWLDLNDRKYFATRLEIYRGIPPFNNPQLSASVKMSHKANKARPVRRILWRDVTPAMTEVSFKVARLSNLSKYFILVFSPFQVIITPDHVGKHCSCLPERKACRYDCAPYGTRPDIRPSKSKVSPVLFDFSRQSGDDEGERVWGGESPFRRIQQDDQERRRRGEEEKRGENASEEMGIDTVDG